MYILNDIIIDNVICSCLQKVRHRMAKVLICFHFCDCHSHKVLNDKYISVGVVFVRVGYPSRRSYMHYASRISAVGLRSDQTAPNLCYVTSYPLSLF